ncbi:protein imuA, partial [Caulobacter sp. 17J65-9]|nr:protein imuA [Caulobacter sp. 17J65-9]
VLRRRPFGVRAGRAAEDGPSAAATRWRIACAPSEPLAGEPGLGRERWKVSLERCRGGRTGAWIMEADDGADPVRVVAELADRQLPAAHEDRRRAAG